MIKLLYALRLRAPPKNEEPPRKPRERPFIIEIYDRLQENEQFSLVHIVVDKGNFDSQVRVGSASTYAFADKITPGKMFAEAQNNYKTCRYFGKTPVEQRNIETIAVSA